MKERQRIRASSGLAECNLPISQLVVCVNRRYDYRYSVLPIVFAHLIRDGHLKNDDLTGLRPEKLELINRGTGLRIL